MSFDTELAEVWVVEVTEDDGRWLPVETYIDKAAAQEELLSWKADAPPTDKWRITRYVPNPEGNAK